MIEYHKIQSVFKRDPATKNKRFLINEYSLKEFEFLSDLDWVGTEKVDGTNVRLFANGYIGGKSDNASLHPNLISVLEVYSQRLTSLDLPEDTIVFGEGYGVKIQSGGHYISDGNDFVVFDVMINGNYQPRESVEDIARKLNLSFVPIIGIASLSVWVQRIQTKSKDITLSLLHPGARNEGVVLRPAVELQTRDGKRIITKLKFKDFDD
jgi:hypothetical protein